MPTKSRTLPLAAIALLAVACSAPASAPTSPPGSSAPTGQPSPSPSPTPAANVIEHPTGATDVVLRYSEEGGFVMPSFNVTRVPTFTLYGDGTVVFQQATDEFPQPLANGSTPGIPLRVTRLDPGQIQEILQFAMLQGGLAGARDQYNNDMVADATSSVFTLNAGGLKKTVSVYALDLDLAPQQGADAPARAAFKKLVERLRDFDRGGSIPTELYVPTAYRGTIFDAGGAQGIAPLKWPWADVKVTDFVADPNGGFPQLKLTPEQVRAVGIPDEVAPGGIRDLYLSGPDGKVYSFAVRPLLPGEDA